MVALNVFRHARAGNPFFVGVLRNIPAGGGRSLKKPGEEEESLSNSMRGTSGGSGLEACFRESNKTKKGGGVALAGLGLGLVNENNDVKNTNPSFPDQKPMASSKSVWDKLKWVVGGEMDSPGGGKFSSGWEAKDQTGRSFGRVNKAGENLRFKDGRLTECLTKLGGETEREGKGRKTDEERALERWRESPWNSGLKTEAQKKQYLEEVKRVYKEVPKSEKNLRKGRKDLTKKLEETWENCILGVDDFGRADLRVQAATKEEYRRCYLRYFVPLLIMRGFD